MDGTEIDTDTLIELVGTKPMLWDKTVNSYKDRNSKQRAWREVCLGLNPGYDEMAENEKNHFGKWLSK